MSTTAIVKKEGSVLNADSKTFCIQLSHYKFRERLLSKAAEHNVKCLIVDESYTTQTCGLCGTRNTNVGGDDIFKCVDDSCGFKYDRDYNAGRNIYLKALSNKKI
jgi:putative transposase